MNARCRCVEQDMPPTGPEGSTAAIAHKQLTVYGRLATMLV